MRVAMIGSGYVGLVSGACFADFGHEVVCIDRDAEKIKSLNRGEIPIYEPGLDTLVASNVKAGRLAFVNEGRNQIIAADVVFIAVGTPTDRRGSGYADLSYVFAVAEELGAILDDRFKVIVIKSTVPVGTGDEVEAILQRTRPSNSFAVVSNPEFLREGAAIQDFKIPDRVIIGTEDERARTVMAELYRPLKLNDFPIVFTGRRTSELIKYASNSFLAMKITFINEIADLCEQAGADVQAVARGIGLDGRIGPKFLHPGPGFGGSCFPKDSLALVKTAEHFNTRMRLVETTLAINDARKLSMASRIRDAMDGQLAGKRLGILGLTFKSNTDDMRDAPSLSIIPALQEGGATIQAYDPAGMSEAEKLLPGVLFRDSPYGAAEGCDALVILTEWDQFRALDFPRLKTIMTSPTLIDLRNVYKPDEPRGQGFAYVSIGRG